MYLLNLFITEIPILEVVEEKTRALLARQPSAHLSTATSTNQESARSTIYTLNWKSFLCAYQWKDKQLSVGEGESSNTCLSSLVCYVMSSDPQEPTMQLFLSDLIATSIIFSNC